MFQGKNGADLGDKNNRISMGYNYRVKKLGLWTKKINNDTK